MAADTAAGAGGVLTAEDSPAAAASTEVVAGSMAAASPALVLVPSETAPAVRAGSKVHAAPSACALALRPWAARRAPGRLRDEASATARPVGTDLKDPPAEAEKDSPAALRCREEAQADPHFIPPSPMGSSTPSVPPVAQTRWWQPTCIP